jgi:hypothetical protein
VLISTNILVYRSSIKLCLSDYNLPQYIHSLPLMDHLKAIILSIITSDTFRYSQWPGEVLEWRKETPLILSRESAYYRSNTAENSENNCVLILYTHTIILSTKKSEGKQSGTSETACSSLGMMSTVPLLTVGVSDQSLMAVGKWWESGGDWAAG